MAKKTAVFVLGTPEPGSAKFGDALTDSTMALLDDITQQANIDADLVFVSLDPMDAGKNKAKLKMAKIKEERGRVLDEIDSAKPDFVVCFGPVATACVFGKGNLAEGNLLRQAHYPLGDDGPPVHVTFSIESMSWKGGIAKWLALDVQAAANGFTETEWGEYDILQPGTDEWSHAPDWLDLSADAVGFDLETYPGLDPFAPDARIRMAVVTDRVGRAAVIQATPDSQLPAWLWSLCENPRVLKAGSNIAFDYMWMRRFGYTIQNMADTSTREHLIDESNPKKDLKSLTFKYVPQLGDYSKHQRDLVRERGGWENVRDDEQYDYCGADGEASIGAYLAQELGISHVHRPWQLYRRLYELLALIQWRGMRVDMDVNSVLDLKYGEKLAGLRKEITQYLGPINLNSPTQLAKALRELVPDINLSVRDWTRAMGDDEDEEAATKREVLEREAHRHHVIPLVLEYRKYRTRHSTFIKGVREKHARAHRGGVFIHPRYRTDVVETYRLSSQAPNGQNIPRKDNDDPELTVKQQFVSRFEGGSFLEADQSQIEIRAAAWLSQDKKMLEAIASGEDIHTAMAALMLGKDAEQVTAEERQSCKHRTFLILYGGGAAKLAKDLKISKRQAQRLIDDYFATFTGLRDYVAAVKAQVKKDLYVETPFGFRRKFVEPEHWDSREGYRIERQAFNTIVQSTAACITYISMLHVEDQMRVAGLKSIMVGQVHDSILIDVAKGEEMTVAHIVKTTMEASGVLAQEFGVNFDVPLACDVEMGSNWGSAKAVPIYAGGNA
jgi:DNA polymerase-1